MASFEKFLFALGDGRVPKKVDWYRLNAERCQKLAQTFTDPEAKRAVSVMADSWLMLAAQRVKNIESKRVKAVLPGDPENKR